MKSLKILMCASLVVALSACGSPKEGGKIDRVRLTDTQKKGMGGLRLSCEKEESIQDFSKVKADQVVSFGGVTEAQQTELVNCRGEVTDVGVMDVKSFQDSFFIGPEMKLENVRFVTVKNSRTCSEFKLEISKDEASAEKVSVRESVLYPSNELLLVYGTGRVQPKNRLNVTDGKNLVEISFYGDCKKSDPDSDKSKVLRELLAQKKCDGPELLSSQQLVIDVSLKRTTVSGIRQIDTCLKK